MDQTSKCKITRKQISVGEIRIEGGVWFYQKKKKKRMVCGA